MLPKFRRYVLVNNSGVSGLLTFTGTPGGRINIKETCWRINASSGKTEYTTLVDDDLGFIAGSSLANGAEIVGDNVIDNTVDGYLGSQIQIEITHDEGTLANGTFDLYISESDTAGEGPADIAYATGYASAEANKLKRIGTLTWEPNGLDGEVMVSNKFSIGN